ncbi:hypothetical protein Pfo_004158, partial [Paulownia fortunei]
KPSNKHISQLFFFLISTKRPLRNRNMETIGEVLDSIPSEFQQPSRLLHAYDTEINFRDGLENLQENWTTTDESEEENRFVNDEDDDPLQILRRFLEELDVEGHEMFKKLVSRVEKDVPIERLLRETLHDFRGRPASDRLEKVLTKLSRGGGIGYTSTQRGANGDISKLKHKLERFKVKAVNVIGSGVVKEEQQ